MGFIENKSIYKNEIRVFTTTRQDGHSNFPYDSFNLSYDVGDNPDDVLKNRIKFVKSLETDACNVIIPHQTHSDRVLKIIDIESNRDGDALYTYNKDLVLCVLHSDCSPIFLYAPDREIIASIHSSIKGTFLEITKKTVKTLISKEGCDPKKMIAIYGPGVSFSHIPADDKMVLRAKNMGYLKCIKKTFDSTYLDTILMNYLQLRSQNIPAENIIMSHYETYDNANMFFSSLRNPTTGRMISLIKFNNQKA